jgi:hypothetical protein
MRIILYYTYIHTYIHTYTHISDCGLDFEDQDLEHVLQHQPELAPKQTLLNMPAQDFAHMFRGVDEFLWRRNADRRLDAVSVCVFACVNIYVYIYIYIYICIYMPVCLSVCLYVCMYVYINIYVYIYK